jgi:hypothetical protein
MTFKAILPLVALSSFIAVAPLFTPTSQRFVNLTAADGTNLKATFFSADKPGPGVLLLHQCNRQRKVWDSLAQQLAAAGINVLTLDYRGFGESGGIPLTKATPQQIQDLQAKWPSDIDLALKYLEDQQRVKRDIIGVGGASCGVNNPFKLPAATPRSSPSSFSPAAPTSTAATSSARIRMSQCSSPSQTMTNSNPPLPRSSGFTPSLLTPARKSLSIKTAVTAPTCSTRTLICPLKLSTGTRPP